MQAIAKDPLVAKERVLGAGLLMIAGLLLPLTSITKSIRPSFRDRNGSLANDAEPPAHTPPQNDVMAAS
jgi:hypothetical protein